MKVARAQQGAAVLDYRQTVLTALGDVENALVSYRTDQQREAGLAKTIDALQNAFDLASDSYRQGIASFIDVLDAQRQLAQLSSSALRRRCKARSIWWRSTRRLAAAGSRISRCSSRITASLATPRADKFRGLGKKRTGTPHSR